MRPTKCSIEGCSGAGNKRYNGTITFTRGYCTKHYTRLINTGNLDILVKLPKHTKCIIDGCCNKGDFDKKRNKEVFNKGYCSIHYGRLIRTGDPTKIKKVFNEGWRKSKLYTTYQGMLSRCYNKKNIKYSRYGGRGIDVCDSWMGVYGFSNFIKDMGDKPTDKHTLDRKDNDKGYSPENCHWATWHQQHSNRENNNKCVGVYYIQKYNNYRAILEVNKHKINLGCFKNYEDAVKARKEAEIKYLNQ